VKWKVLPWIPSVTPLGQSPTDSAASPRIAAAMPVGLDGTIVPPRVASSGTQRSTRGDSGGVARSRSARVSMVVASCVTEASSVSIMIDRSIALLVICTYARSRKLAPQLGHASSDVSTGVLHIAQ
jgi:hypothetical protein